MVYSEKTIQRTKRWSQILLAVLFAVGVVHAEEEQQRVAVSQVEQARFDKDLEQRLSRDIKAYLDHEFFIVQVKTLLEKVNTFDVSKQKITVPMPSPPQAPAQDAARQQLLQQMELDTEDGINAETLQQDSADDLALPGLPVSERVFAEKTRSQQQDFRQPRQSQMQPQPLPPVTPAYETREETKRELKDSRIDIKQMSLKVVLDTHVTPEQETFVRNLVIEKANVNFIRGDELRLVRTEFPGSGVLDPKQEEKPVVEEVSGDTPAEAAAPVEEIPDWQQKIQQWLQDYWPYLLAILAFLALWLLLRRTVNKEESVQPQPVVAAQSDSKDKLDAFIEKLSFSQDTMAEQKLQALREELVSMSVTEKTMFTEQLMEWLNAGGQEDVGRVAAIYNLIGSGLMVGLLKGHISAEKMVGLAAMAEELARESSPSEQMEKIEQAFQTLARRRFQEKITEEHKIRPFDFLERLNDDQVLYLLTDERLPVRALVYSQLPAERAAGLLKRIANEERGALAMEISRFSQLPAASFRDIANRLAKKAVDVPSFANISVDGVDVLIGMLDHMDSSEETALLASVRQSNPDLFYRIKQIYVGFNDLVNMPTMALKNLIREVSRDDLALALYDVDESFRDTILSSMLERPRAMLLSVIRDLKDADAQAVNEAKRKVARRARAMLKAGEFKMPQPEAAKTQGAARAAAKQQTSQTTQAAKPKPPATPPPAK